MKRFVVSCSLWVAAVAGCNTLFPSGGGGTSGSLTGLDPDGGVCEKDPQTIKNVMLAPPTCNATNPCPCGTFCSSQTGGNCVADCVDDSWCAPGHVCSGYGQCLAATDGGTGEGGPGPSVDPACPRNEALLDSLNAMNRPCQFDDICPFGSYCDHVQERCHADCRSDAQCAGFNSPGHTFVCGCLGKCAEVAAPRVEPTENVPTMEVNPTHFTFIRPAYISEPVWGGGNTRQVNVDLVVPSITGTGTDIVATIQANAGPGLMVQCPTGSPTGGFCTFNVLAQDFHAADGAYKTNPIGLILSPSTAAPTATNWSLRLESKNVANAPQTVTLKYNDVVLPPPTPNLLAPMTAPSPSFRGTGRVQFATPTGAQVSIAVKGRAAQVCRTTLGCANELVLYDDTFQLSPSGKIAVGDSEVAPGNMPVFLDIAPDSDTALSGILQGSLPQRMVSPPTLVEDTSTGTIYGSYSRAIYTDNESVHSVNGTDNPPTGPFDVPATVTFALHLTGSSAGFCEQAADCPQGMQCELGFCSPGPPRRLTITNGGRGVEIRQHQNEVAYGANDPNVVAVNRGKGLRRMYAPTYLLTAGTPMDVHLIGTIPSISGEPLAHLTSGTTTLDGLRQIAIPLLTQHDGVFPPTAAQLLSSCISDMSVDPAQVPQTLDATCISLARVETALNDQNNFQRLLEGVLDVTSFISREGLEVSKLSDALTDSATNQSAITTAPSLAQILGAAERGLGLFVNSGVQQDAPFQFMSAFQIWTTIDNRFQIESACYTDDECGNGLRCVALECRPPSLSLAPQHEQPLGVPTFALRAAGSYLRVLETYLRRTASQTFGQGADTQAAVSRQTALAHFGTAMRLVLAIEQLAVGINVKAGVDTNAGTCPGAPEDCAVIAERFNAASAEMNAMRIRVTAAAQALHDGVNPLNIPDDDVPLFFGDPIGNSSRYFAASDYLLNSWAVPGVAEAQAFLDAARSGWISQTSAAVQDELNQHNRKQEIDGLMSKYGSTLITNCGSLQASDGAGGIRILDSTEVIPYFADSGTTLSNSSCFIDQTCIGAPDSLDPNKQLKKVLSGAFLDPFGNLLPQLNFPSAADALLKMEDCKLGGVSQGPVPQRTIEGGPGLHRLCVDLRTSQDPCHVIFNPGDGNLYIRATIAGLVNNIPLASLYMKIRKADIGPGNFYSIASYGYQLPPLDDLTLQEDQDLGNPIITFPGPDDDIYRYIDPEKDPNYPQTYQGCRAFYGGDFALPNPGVLPPECYKGQMGVSYYEVQTNILTITKAQQVLDNGQKDVAEREQSCHDLESHNAQLNAITDHYNAMKNDYQLVSALSDGFKSSITPEGIDLLKGGATFAFDLFGDAVKDEADHLEQMEKLFSREEKIQECWNTFRSMRRGLATAMTDIQIAVQSMFAEKVKFQNMAAQNTLDLQEGISVLKQERASPVSSLGHVFWVDEKVEQFRREFEWARRLTYLAMRAVEFEFQQSLPFRSQIVSATTPAQLQDAIIGLQREQAARTINRRRPDEASVVLSLRDDVLAISSRTDAPAGERNWTAAQRFSSRLFDDSFAFRDREGNYLGQAIPFTLGPSGILETRCGERLWRATATIQGDGVDETAPGASVLLLKRNTFSSQYCQGKAPAGASASGAPQMQVGVVHTSANLFQPGSEVDLSDANQFTASLLYPWFNVRRTDFYKKTYQDGASEELAGRGLYGDYVLLFPKQVLEDGFALDKVEDVLLRLDYLSVDNLSQ